jgi:uncharacterized protein DUF4270
MNLLDKKLRIGAMVMALFLLISCEESGDFALGDLDISPVDFFSENIAVTSSVLLIDSIPTDSNDNLLVGTMENDQFGYTKGQAYAKLNLNKEQLVDILDDAVLDSAHFNFKLNYKHNVDLNVFDLIIGAVIPNSIHDTVTYYTDSNAPRVLKDKITGQPVEIGRGRVDVGDLDSVITMDLNDEWAVKFFNDLKAQDPRLNDQESFETQYLGGLAFIPGDFNTGMFGIETVEESNMVLYFHQTSPTGTGFINFSQVLTYHDAKHFYVLEHDKSGSDIAEVQERATAYEPSSGLRYIQEGNGIVTKFDLSAFGDFVESNPDVIINFADLIIGPIQQPFNLNDPPPQTLLLYITDEQNTLIKDRSIFRGIQKDSDSTTGVIGSSNTIALDYDPTTNSYKGSMTSFIQSYHAGVFQRNEVLLFTSNMNSSVNGVVLDPDNIELKIFYSELK